MGQPERDVANLATERATEHDVEAELHEHPPNPEALAAGMEVDLVRIVLVGGRLDGDRDDGRRREHHRAWAWGKAKRWIHPSWRMTYPEGVDRSPRGTGSFFAAFARTHVRKQGHRMSEAGGSDRKPTSFWRRNALSLASLGLFMVFLVGMTLTGHEEFNADQVSHQEAPVSLPRYVDDVPTQSSADPNTPWPVRRGGIALKLYENSLALAFVCCSSPRSSAMPSAV